MDITHAHMHTRTRAATMFNELGGRIDTDTTAAAAAAAIDSIANKKNGIASLVVLLL